MNLAIDNIQQYAASEQFYLNLLAGCTNRYHVSRVCVHATVIQDPTTSMRVRQFRGVDLAMREAQEWQSDQEFLPDTPAYINLLWGTSTPKIVGEMSIRNDSYAVWHLQLDVVDLLNRRRPGKRLRTTINPFHQVPAPPKQDAAPGNQLPKAKRFKGVRYRRERRKWAAEMKPPKYKDKVSFGEFKSQAQAARAIDAAFHYYRKPYLLNFPDTPEILSTRPSPAGVLNKEDKLRFVKEQVKSLAFIASTLPSSPPSVPQIPESPSRVYNRNTSLFQSISEFSSFFSCGDADVSDDGISQRLFSLPPDALAELVGSALMEPPFVSVDAVGGIMESLKEHQGMFEWSLEDNFVHPSLSGRWPLDSSVQFPTGWDGAEVSSAPAAANLLNFPEPSCESPGSWMNYLAMSPPASMLPMPP